MAVPAEDVSVPGVRLGQGSRSDHRVSFPRHRKSKHHCKKKSPRKAEFYHLSGKKSHGVAD